MGRKDKVVVAAMARVWWGGDNRAMAKAMAAGQWKLEGGYVNQNEETRQTKQACHPVVMAVETGKETYKQSGRRKNGEKSSDGCEGICDECPRWTVETVMVNGGNEKNRRLVKTGHGGGLDWVATQASSTGIA